MTPIIHIVPILRDNYCFLIEGENKKCLIVDPGQSTPVYLELRGRDLTPVAILNTHHHADHVAGNKELKDRYKIPVIGPEAESASIPHMDTGVSEGASITYAGIELVVFETPGHTNGHISFYNDETNSIFCGDTVFSMGCGRLVEGTADMMWNTLKRFKQFPQTTLLYCGHEYTKENGDFAASCFPGNSDIAARVRMVAALRDNAQPTIPTTIGQELKTNPFFMATDLQQFAQRRKAKDHF